MSSKRIGYVLRRFPSLSETFILNEIIELEKLGRKLEIYAILQPRDTRYHSGIARLVSSIRYLPNLYDLKSLWVYNARARKRFGLRYWKVFFICLASLRPTLVWRHFEGAYVAERAMDRKLTHLHAHFANKATTVAWVAHKLTGIPYSFTGHAVDLFKEPLNRKVLAKKINDAAFVVTVSDSNKTYLEEFTDNQPEKIVRIYNGIDLEKFSPGEIERPERFTILCVARFVEKKGLDILIDACAQLDREGRDFQCLMIGKGQARRDLVARIDAGNLKSKVRLLSAHTQDEIVERFRAADVFALPCVVGDDGNRDGLPVSIVEALACGVPVVSTPVNGIPEAVEDGKNGLIVEPGDAGALAAAIGGLMDDRERLAELAGNARSSVAERFDSHETTRALNRLFDGPGS